MMQFNASDKHAQYSYYGGRLLLKIFNTCRLITACKLWFNVIVLVYIDHQCVVFVAQTDTPGVCKTTIDKYFSFRSECQSSSAGWLFNWKNGDI